MNGDSSGVFFGRTGCEWIDHRRGKRLGNDTMFRIMNGSVQRKLGLAMLGTGIVLTLGMIFLLYRQVFVENSKKSSSPIVAGMAVGSCLSFSGGLLHRKSRHML